MLVTPPVSSSLSVSARARGSASARAAPSSSSPDARSAGTRSTRETAWGMRAPSGSGMAAARLGRREVQRGVEAGVDAAHLLVHRGLVDQLLGAPRAQFG